VGDKGWNGKGAANKSKRELAAEKEKLEDELDSVEPARATDQHLERCDAMPTSCNQS